MWDLTCFLCTVSQKWPDAGFAPAQGAADVQ